MTEMVFAQGMSFYKLFLVFVAGAFVGDLAETVFCRIKFGRWTNRSSLVYGQLSAVWGFAMVIATLLYYKLKAANVADIFVVGAVLGGVYEYFCSVFTEKCLGAKFWDYSKHRFNLAGRVNLRYCIYWGAAAVIWIKGAFPWLEKLIERIPEAAGEPLCNVLFALIVADAGISAMALKRYGERQKDTCCKGRVWDWFDVHFPDQWMEARYPCMKLCGKRKFEKKLLTSVGIGRILRH